MKKTLLILQIFLLFQHQVYSTEESNTAKFEACDKDNRSETCNDIYQPVCGFGDNNKV